MSDTEKSNCPKCPPTGAPAWMATFADLATLLMCFFVLLLSFSEMDVLKFKQLAGSMNEAFGVQNQIKVEDIPKGTSIIAQEFSPGRPEPTPINEIRQMTMNNDMNTLDVLTTEGERDSEDPKAALEELKRQEEEQARQEAVAFATTLAQEIGDGEIEIETDGSRIIIRIKDRGSFDSGSAELKIAYLPIIEKIRDLLITVSGRIAVEGHSDSIPYNGDRYRSNWDLSVARALAVAHELFADTRVGEDRFTVSGKSSSEPLAPNDTPENRSTNRRVEIVIQKSGDQELSERIQASQPGRIERQRLAPSEIF